MNRNEFLKTLVGLFTWLIYGKVEAKETSEWLPPGIYTKDAPYCIATFDRYGKRVTHRLVQVNTITGEIQYYKLNKDGNMLEDPEKGELIRETSFASAPLKCRKFNEEDREFFFINAKKNPSKVVMEGCTCKEWISTKCPMWKYHDRARQIREGEIVV
jgi:hypothetical protein